MLRSVSLLQLLLLLLLQLICSHFAFGLLASRFIADTRSRTILAKEAWQVGSPTAIALLHLSNMIPVRMRFEKNDCTDPKFFLLVRCHDHVEIFALNSDTRSNLLCRLCKNGVLRFVPTNSNFSKSIIEMNFQLFLSSPGSDENAGSIQVKVQAICKLSDLVSNSLYLWVFNGLMDYNGNKITYKGSQISNRFLTEDAIKLLLSDEAFYPADKTFNTIQFIDPRFITKFTSLPFAIKSILGFQAIVDLKAMQCDANGEYIRFGHKPYAIDSGASTVSLAYHIDYLTGSMTYAPYVLSRVMSSRQADVNSKRTVTLCAQLHASQTEADYLNKKEMVLTMPHAYTVMGKTPTDSNAKCQVAASAITNVEIASGFSDVIVTCPIICSESNADFEYKFQRGADTISHQGTSDWSGEKPIEVSKFGKYLKFSSDVTPSHGGQYSCHAPDGTAFHFNVTIMSLPHFDEASSPPAKVVAVEGQPLSLSCKALYHNLPSVTLAPVIVAYLYNVRWKSMSLSDFNKNLRLEGDSQMKVSETQLQEGKRLTMSISSVPPANVRTGFAHRFVCKASVSESDSQKFGMREYFADTATDIVFLRRPQTSDFALSVTGNDCSKPSTASCTAADGAVFTVRVNSSLIADVSKIGAVMRIKFTVDRLNHIQAELKELFDSNLMSVTSDEGNGVMSLNISKLPDGAMRDQFLKLQAVYPVIELHYSNDSAAAALAQTECSSNANCFFSTANPSTGLSDLRFTLSSKGNPSTAANLGLITDNSVKTDINFISNKFDFRTKENPITAAELEFLAPIVLIILISLIIVSLLIFIRVRKYRSKYRFKKTAEQKTNEDLELFRSHPNPDY